MGWGVEWLRSKKGVWYRAVVLKEQAMGQQQQPHLKVIRRANSDPTPRPSESDISGMCPESVFKQPIHGTVMHTQVSGPLSDQMNSSVGIRKPGL